MLVEFKVGNYSSFKDIQSLRMAEVLRAKPVESEKEHIRRTDYGGITRTMFLYGPNNAGKSNLIKAMRDAVEYIKDGDVLNRYGELCFKSLPYLYKGNNPKTVQSYFEFVISIDGCDDPNDNGIYSFGFNIGWDNYEPRLVCEWLYRNSSNGDECIYLVDWDCEGHPCIEGRDQVKKLINRVCESHYEEDDIESYGRGHPIMSGYFIDYYWKQNDCISPPEYLLKIRESLTDSFVFKIGDDPHDRIVIPSTSPGAVMGYCNQLLGMRGINNRIELNLSKSGNKDVSGFNDVEVWFNDPDYQNDVNGRVGNWTNEDMYGPLGITLRYGIHEIPIKFRDGFTFTSKVADESSGTFRLVYLCILLMYAERRSKMGKKTVLVIDEIESSLSTYALFQIINLFKKNENNRFKDVQLIATTHESRILENRSMWRIGVNKQNDNVWNDPEYFGNSIGFVQRTPSGQDGSEIYSLRSFGKTDVRNCIGYVNHEYGSVPRIKKPRFVR